MAKNITGLDVYIYFRRNGAPKEFLNILFELVKRIDEKNKRRAQEEAIKSASLSKYVN